MVDVYANSTTFSHGNYFSNIVPISKGTIQGDTLTPYLFVIFLELLLRWLKVVSLGYHFDTSTSTCITIAYANDLAILTDNIDHLQPQINKLLKIAEWAHMNLNLTKWAIT